MVGPIYSSVIRTRRVTTSPSSKKPDLSFIFLSSENHILEDVNKCVIALQEKDVDALDRTAGAIRGRAARVIHVVTSEMDNYEPGVYTEKVLEATKLLSNTGLRTVSPPRVSLVPTMAGSDRLSSRSKYWGLHTHSFYTQEWQRVLVRSWLLGSSRAHSF